MDLGIVVTGIDNLTAPFEKMNSSIKKVGESSQETANRLKAIQVVIGGILLEKAEELTKKFVDMASASQNLDARLASWSGGTKQASSVVDEFTKKLGASGIGMEKLGDAFVKLRAAGLSVGQAQTTIENITNGIAAVGGGNLEDKLQNAANAFALFISRGTVGQKELRSIVQDTGLTFDDLAKAIYGSTGKADDAVQKFDEAIKDHILSATQLLDGFNKAAQQKFGGFVQLLGATVGGALNQFRADFSKAFSDLTEGAGVDVQIAVFIKNLDDAVVSFISHLDRQKIQSFFNALQDFAGVGANVATTLFTLATFAFNLFDTIAKFVNWLPPAAQEYGVIGYVLFGKVGAAVGVGIGILDNDIRLMGSKIDQFFIDHNFAKGFFQKDLQNNQKSTLDALLTPDSNTIPKSPQNNWFSKLFGTPEQIKAFLDQLKQLQAYKFPGGTQTTNGANNDLQNRIRAAEDAFQATLGSVSGKVQLDEAKAAGDGLGATIQELTNKSNGYKDALTKAYDALVKSKAPESDLKAAAAQRLALNDRIDESFLAQEAHARLLNVQKQIQFRLEQQISQMQLSEQIRQQNLSTGQLSDPTQGFLSGTQAGRVVEQVIQEKAKFALQIAQAQSAINQAAIKMNDEAANPANLAALEKTVQLYQQQQQSAQAAAQATTATAILQKKFLQDLAQTMENDIGNAISGLIKGTMTWADAGRQLFGDLIDMAVKYMLQLVELKLFGEAAATASLAATAPIAAAQMAIWSPAAIAASIATLGGADAIGVAAYQTAIATSILGFADGGIPGISDLSGRILNGPTMFGVAGEAGTEAVMPLKRTADGKLGVAATGGAGGDIHIHLHTIDQKTGAEFLMANMGTIGAGLRHQRFLNQGQR